jgi:methionyl-tRNA formyltransferase
VLKILRAAVINSGGDQERGDLTPGTVIARPEGPAVITGRGALQLYEVQLAGKRPVSADAFARGARGFVGGRLT